MNEIAHSQNVRIGTAPACTSRELVRPSLTMFIQSLIEKSAEAKLGHVLVD